MSKLNATRLVELMLPAALLKYVCLSCHEVHKAEGPPMLPEEERAHQLVIGLLSEAEDAPLGSMMQKEKDKLIRRRKRLVEDVYAPYIAANANLMKMYLLTMYWVGERINEGDLILYAGTPFDQAYEFIKEQLLKKMKLAEEVEGSATKQVRKFHAAIQAHGYYR